MSIKQIYAYYDPKQRQSADGFQYCPFCRAELKLEDRGGRPRPTCSQCGFVQFHNLAPAVSILVVQNDQMLLGQRRGDPGAGQWALPSGYVEYVDDFLTTAVRETKEETGLDVTIKGVLNVVSSFLSPRFHFFAVYVLARVVGGELSARDDLDAVEWFPLSGPWPELAFQEDADMLLLLASSGCAASTADPASEILGRWQRVGQPGIGEPASLLSEYVEFRENGQLVMLLFDQGPGQFWTTGSERYALVSRDRVQVTGTCWQGWESYECSRVYGFALGGDTLRIFDGPQTERQVEYQRIGTIDKDLPPTLAPPFPSPTPS